MTLTSPPNYASLRLLGDRHPAHSIETEPLFVGGDSMHPLAPARPTKRGFCMSEIMTARDLEKIEADLDRVENETVALMAMSVLLGPSYLRKCEDQIQHIANTRQKVARLRSRLAP